MSPAIDLALSETTLPIFSRFTGSPRISSCCCRVFASGTIIHIARYTNIGTPKLKNKSTTRNILIRVTSRLVKAANPEHTPPNILSCGLRYRRLVVFVYEAELYSLRSVLSPASSVSIPKSFGLPIVFITSSTSAIDITSPVLGFFVARSSCILASKSSIISALLLSLAK